MDQIRRLVAGAGPAYDTLQELQQELEKNDSVAATLQQRLTRLEQTLQAQTAFVGQIIAVASHLQGSASLPESGAVSGNGWMRCDDAAIPTGQTLQGHTPNLTDGRFLRGASQAGGQGSAEQFTLRETNLPAHTHAMAHTHNGSTTSAHGHNHTGGGITGLSWRQTTHNQRYLVSAVYNSHARGGNYIPTNSFTTQPAGAHQHDVTVEEYQGSSGSTGLGNPKRHLPQYDYGTAGQGEPVH